MLTKLFLPMFAEGAGVVNISSTRASMSQPDTESYSAAKGAISALTHALAASLAGKVRVNAIAPGWIDTGAEYDPTYVPDYTRGDIAQHTSGRVGEPGDIARAAMFLLDARNSFINAQTIIVDGGMSRLMIYAGEHGWEYSE
jgi:NAD(P)-dependent dehydrogenase (short-subunit alcohol dehydrogenase family)